MYKCKILFQSVMLRIPIKIISIDNGNTFKFYLFIFGCIGSSLLCAGFL